MTSLLTTIPILAGLSAALTWGAADYSGGIATKRTNALWVVFISQFIGIILLFCLALAWGENIPSNQSLLYGAAAGLVGEFGLLALYQGLALGRMGIVAPLSAVIGALLPATFGIFLEGLPGIATLSGILIALLAIWLIAASAPVAGIQKAELFYPLLAGGLFGIYFILVDQASAETIFFPLLTARLAAAIFMGLIVLWKKPVPKPGKLSLPWIAATGFLDTTGNLFYAWATRAGRLDEAVILSSLYPATTVLLAMLFLHERLARSQWLGVLFALLAVILIGS